MIKKDFFILFYIDLTLRRSFPLLYVDFLYNWSEFILKNLDIDVFIIFILNSYNLMNLIIKI